MPRYVDQLQVVQFMEHLRGSRLRNVGLGRQCSRSRFLILAAAEAYKRTDDRIAARATRQRSLLRCWGRRGPSLASDEPWRAQVKVSLGIRPGPTVPGQDCSERFGYERRDHQRT